VHVRRTLGIVWFFVLSLALPAAAFAATGSTATNEAPTGHDYTLDTIFVVALGIPLVLTILTLIDIARGKHTERHADH
jgi:hypothetical protein